MGGKKPTLGYESRTAAIVALRSRNLSAEQIARKIGVSVNAVQSLESHYRRLLAGRGAGSEAISLTPEQRRLLYPYAAVRDITLNELVQRIIVLTIESDLVDAVLDDGIAP